MRKQNLILAICLAMSLSFAGVVGCGKKQPDTRVVEGRRPICQLIERFGCQYIWCSESGGHAGMGGLVAADHTCRPQTAVEKN